MSLEAGALHSLFDSMVTTLHKGHKNSSALPVVSAMLARLMALTGTSIVEKRDQPVYKQLMFVESARRETFTSWPHMDYRYGFLLVVGCSMVLYGLQLWLQDRISFKR